MRKALELFILLLLLSSPAFAAFNQFNASDAYLNSSSPTTNQNNINGLNFGGSNSVLLQFSTSSISGQHVDKAYLWIWSNRASNVTINLYRILPSVNISQTTWNVSSTGNNWNTAGAGGSGTDYTATNAGSGPLAEGSYQIYDVSGLMNDCVAAGNTCTMKISGWSGTYNGAASSNPPYVLVSSYSGSTPTTWYVRDGGGNFGITSSTCNGQTNATFTGSNGPNCAVNHPVWILGNATNYNQNNTSAPQLWLSGGETLSIDGDSDLNYFFTFSGVTTLPLPGATYTNNGHTYTVIYANAQSGSAGSYAGVILASAGGLSETPSSSGTLTKSAGTGDATISFSAEATGQAQYVIGHGMPDGNCSSACNVGSIPAGPSSSAETIVTGTGSQLPEIWGNYGINHTFTATAGNTTLENLEFDQHSSCSWNINSMNPGQSYNSQVSKCSAASPTAGAQYFLQLAGTNVTTSGLYLHGAALADIYFTGALTNWSSTNDRIIAAGDFLDDGGSMSFGGNNTMNGDVWAFGGCAQKWPTPDPLNPRDLNNYLNCADQNNGAAYQIGGGFMMQNDSQAPCGNWTISNSQFLYNLKTNIDFLHCSGSSVFNFYRSRSEGSTGETLKLNGSYLENVEESQLIGNEAAWSTTPFQNIKAPYSGSGGSWNYLICRGDAVELYEYQNGSTQNFINDDIEGNCTALLELGGGDTCNSASVNVSNSKLIGGWSWYSYSGGTPQNVSLFYNGGDDGNGDGPCGTPNGKNAIPFNSINNSIYNVTTYAGVGCNGTNSVCGDPKITAELSATMTNLVGPANYYSGTNFGDYFYLQAGSPLIGAGTSNVNFTNPLGSEDYNQQTASSPPDIGAYTSSSCVNNNGVCSQNSQCCNASTGTGCSAEQQCNGTCTINGGSCTTASGCCSGVCLSGTTCGNCIANGSSDSGYASNCCSGLAYSGNCVQCIANGDAAANASQCCSGLIQSGNCVAYVCGDGIMPEGSKVCDVVGPNLNGQSCATEGYYGGTLGCTPGCLSFNTSQCYAKPAYSLGMSGSAGMD
jgi:hypothetical protein